MRAKAWPGMGTHPQDQSVENYASVMCGDSVWAKQTLGGSWHIISVSRKGTTPQKYQLDSELEKEFLKDA